MRHGRSIAGQCLVVHRVVLAQVQEHAVCNCCPAAFSLRVDQVNVRIFQVHHARLEADTVVVGVIGVVIGFGDHHHHFEVVVKHWNFLGLRTDSTRSGNRTQSIVTRQITKPTNVNFNHLVGG